MSKPKPSPQSPGGIIEEGEIISKVEECISEVRNLQRDNETIHKDIKGLQDTVNILNSDRNLMEEQIRETRDLKTIVKFLRERMLFESDETQKGINAVKKSVENIPGEVKEHILESVDKKDIAIKQPFLVQLRKLFQRG